MTQEVTLKSNKKIESSSVSVNAPTASTADLKPDAKNASEPSTQLTAELSTKKRSQTWGEKKFNFLNYGGFALLGNEIGGTWLTKQAENGMFKESYAKFAEKFTRHANNPLVPKYASSGRMPMIFVAIISGNFMVPFIKYFEDRKGEIVRRMDRKHYGEKSETDPALIAAHKEMDEAPKQSWSSLWKGRVSTMITAFGIDSLIGWKGAPTTLLFKNNATYQRFASYDRVAEAFGEGTAKVFNVSAKNKPAFVEWTARGASLLTLSSVLTLLFYASSKVFAKKRDEKMERLGHSTHSVPARDDATNEPMPDASLTKATERPEAKVTDIKREATITANQAQLAASH